MKQLSTGKIRGLQQIANPDGILTICAMDHRESLLKMIDREHPEQVTYQAVVERKRELCSSLAEHASAVLLDPIYGAAQCISHNILPKNTGLLVSIEASGYAGGEENRLTELLTDWSVSKIKRMGASAVKMLVYYRPDLKELAAKQLNTVSKVAIECQKYDIPFLVEPKSYPIGSEIGNPPEFARIKEQLVIQTARDITSLPIDVLKAEFPADLRYNQDTKQLANLCRQLDNASRVPWVILSAGVGFADFCREVEIACRAGASGFLGGRAIWQEAMSLKNAPERLKYLSTVGADRFKKLAGIASKHASPWYKKLNLDPAKLATIPEGWYKEY